MVMFSGLTMTISRLVSHPLVSSSLWSCSWYYNEHDHRLVVTPWWLTSLDMVIVSGLHMTISEETCGSPPGLDLSMVMSMDMTIEISRLVGHPLASSFYGHVYGHDNRNIKTCGSPPGLDLSMVMSMEHDNRNIKTCGHPLVLIFLWSCPWTWQ